MSDGEKAAEKPVTLHPVEFEAAMRALLEVQPEKQSERKKSGSEAKSEQSDSNRGDESAKS